MSLLKFGLLLHEWGRRSSLRGNLILVCCMFTTEGLSNKEFSFPRQLKNMQLKLYQNCWLFLLFRFELCVFAVVCIIIIISQANEWHLKMLKTFNETTWVHDTCFIKKSFLMENSLLNDFKNKRPCTPEVFGLGEWFNSQYADFGRKSCWNTCKIARNPSAFTGFLYFKILIIIQTPYVSLVRTNLLN